MGRDIKIWELALAAMFCLLCWAFMVRALYEVTWLPMAENWKQCHRIALCAETNPKREID